METALFFIMAAVAIAAGGMVILNRNPVKSAFSLIVVMLALAILYMQLSATFLAIIQIMVYAGAVMVLFLFVLFILNVGVEGAFSPLIFRRIIAGLTGAIMGITLIAAILFRGSRLQQVSGGEIPVDFGHVEPVGELLFTKYLLPFELLSILLLVAIIGAILATRPKWPMLKLPPELWPDTAEDTVQELGEEN
jgi:NADH-quinone oxidoreductase subunit J